MEKRNLLYVIVFIAVLVLAFLILVIAMPKNGKKPANTSAPTPTLANTGEPVNGANKSSLPGTVPTIASGISPTLIPVNPFTGVADHQDIPKEETDLATQKRDLRRKTPLTESAFSLAFDYADDMFVVTLNDPRETSKTAFNQWLKANYPLIPLDRFGFR